MNEQDKAAYKSEILEGFRELCGEVIDKALAAQGVVSHNLEQSKGRCDRVGDIGPERPGGDASEAKIRDLQEKINEDFSTLHGRAQEIKRLEERNDQQYKTIAEHQSREGDDAKEIATKNALIYTLRQEAEDAGKKFRDLDAGHFAIRDVLVSTYFENQDGCDTLKSTEAVAKILTAELEGLRQEAEAQKSELAGLRGTVRNLNGKVANLEGEARHSGSQDWRNRAKKAEADLTMLRSILGGK